MTNKLFLSWLVYICVVLALLFVSYVSGLMPFVISLDKSYLTIILCILYGISEIFSFFEFRKVNLIQNQVATLKSVNDVLQPSIFKNFIDSIKERKKNGGDKNVFLLSESFTDKLYISLSTIYFFSSKIVWFGIFATIVGIILSFLPFLSEGLTADTIKNNMTTFFSGVAVAFIPTAISFVFKIALDISTEILSRAIDNIIADTKVIVETTIVPEVFKD